jgi:hypothetical protein
VLGRQAKLCRFYRCFLSLPLRPLTSDANAEHCAIVNSDGRPIRVFYAFDPRRMANLLIGGDKTGHDRFCERTPRIADALYNIYIDEIGKEGLIP